MSIYFRIVENPSLDHVVAIELLAHRTWPCHAQQTLGDWILRANHGFTRRANSCLALGDPGMALGCAIGQVEAWYRDRGLEPCVKVCTGTDGELDELLESRAWSIATPTRVMEVATIPEPTLRPEFLATDSPDPDWLATLSGWDGECSEKAARHAEIAHRMENSGFASWMFEGQRVAVAVACLEGPAAHLYDLVVREDLRGKGIGRVFLEAFLAWCHSRGGQRAYLQVLESNEGARRLYERMGFREHHRYHYRVACGVATPTSGC